MLSCTQFMNITLSHDNRTVLLDSHPLYPIRTIPSPPEFYAMQFPSTFSNKNLSAGLVCSNPWCGSPDPDLICEGWCFGLSLSNIKFDYLYTVKPAEYNGEGKHADAQYWEVAMDVIGGHSGYQDDPDWVFDDASQKMLWVLVAGKEVKKGSRKGEGHNKAAGDLFGPLGDKERIYEYQIVDVRLEARAYTFPPEKPLTFWGKIRRFFGNDVWEVEGSRFVYRAKDWDYYGKKGTLRKIFGDFVHWDFWYLFWIISGATIAGLVVLFGIYKLFIWLQQQRDLATWDGMDDVWDNLRQERINEEEDALLDGRYRDDPDEGGSSGPPRYTDEPQTMKPLPSKPLPEKPLPDVPLIDT
ncbi:Nn.00g062170.m01.CDS01 [Neocucurbitaria sp. VM-36]